MWENYHSTKIQNFYRKFIKCERNTDEKCKIFILEKKGDKIKKKSISIKCPICPLYKAPYNEKHRLKIIEKPYCQNITNIWHFDINSLIEWLNICKEWKNPLTNCLFLNKTQDKIWEFANNVKTKRKLKIPINYNKKEIGYKKNKSKMDILLEYIKTKNKDECFNFLKNNYENIKFDEDIEESIIFNDDIINPIGLLHLAVMNDDAEILRMLIYFGAYIDKKCGENGYNAFHMCAILNKIELGKVMAEFGANLYSICFFDDDLCNIFDICEKLGNYNFINEVMKTSAYDD